jgi:hypothetical protein
MGTLWCKIQENPSDRISHAWAPFLKRAKSNWRNLNSGFEEISSL